MANVVVTSDATTVHVDFGIFALDPQESVPQEGYFDRKDILEVFRWTTHIEVLMLSGGRYDLKVEQTDGIAALVVDSVDGVEPTDLSHLLQLIKNLMI